MQVFFKWLFIPILLILLLLPSQVFAKPPKFEETWVYVDLWKRRLYVMEGNHIKAEFIIGIGKKETPTPIGDWIITDKSKNWGSGFGPCWLGLNVPWGRFGIHGTNKPHSVGSKASHGCLRLLNSDIKRLYPMLPVGSRVKIDGPILGMDEYDLPKLVKGHKGTLVQLVQNRLSYAGYYHGGIDGIFGTELEKAILQFQKEKGLEKSGQVYEKEYLELGLLE
ncbi:MAG: L,D-transpeptidase family protein [Thermoactinomyces sp.]